jgi:Bacterial conjugation TrbI-like protein
MSPRRFLNFFRSPTGALTLFLLGLVVVLILVNSRRPSQQRVSLVPAKLFGKKDTAPQVPETVRRDMVPFDPKSANQKPEATPAPPAPKPDSTPLFPVLSVVADTPAAPTKEPKKFSDDFAPFGRLIPCELVITVDSSSIQTPIIGLVTEDIFHHGQLIIPAGTEVHGSAQVDRARERIASNGRWTLVWQNGQELNVSGLALDHDRDADTGTWGITDGSAGLRGKLLKTDNLAEVKLYVAALLSGAAEAFTDKGISAFGTFALPSLQNAPLKGAQAVLDRYAQQILNAIERDGFYVRVPAGKQFYLYITQTVDEDDAKIGGTLTAALHATGDASPTPSPGPQRPFIPPISDGMGAPRDSAPSTLQPSNTP